MSPFEFDPRNRRTNVEKHGIDFATASRLWDDLVFERRFIALGAIESRVL
jgi:uncharacterized DUF497 family protein